MGGFIYILLGASSCSQHVPFFPYKSFQEIKEVGSLKVILSV